MRKVVLFLIAGAAFPAACLGQGEPYEIVRAQPFTPCAEPVQTIEAGTNRRTLAVKGPLTPDYSFAATWTSEASNILAVTISAARGATWIRPVGRQRLILGPGGVRMDGDTVERGASTTTTYTLVVPALAENGVTAIELRGKQVPLGSYLTCGLNRLAEEVKTGPLQPAAVPNQPGKQAEKGLTSTQGESVDPCSGVTASVTTDRFTGDTEIVAKLPPTAFRFQPFLYWSSKAPDALLFEVMGSSQSWRYLNCPVLAILSDNERVPLTHVTHGGEVSTGFVVESLNGVISWNDGLKMSKVSKFEYKACNDEFVAEQKFACQVRDLIREAQKLRATSKPK